VSGIDFDKLTQDLTRELLIGGQRLRLQDLRRAKNIDQKPRPEMPP
jgi:hypothetical protein